MSIKQECRRCGNCCRADFSAYARDDDIVRWTQEGRSDILSFFDKGGNIWAGDVIISVCAKKKLERCVFLLSDGKRCSCAIYETRPRACRQYQPASNFLCLLFYQDERT